MAEQPGSSKLAALDMTRFWPRHAHATTLGHLPFEGDTLSIAWMLGIVPSSRRWSVHIGRLDFLKVLGADLLGQALRNVDDDLPAACSATVS